MSTCVSDDQSSRREMKQPPATTTAALKGGREAVSTDPSVETVLVFFFSPGAENQCARRTRNREINHCALMYIATPEQPASYLFITRTSHLNHTRLQNEPHTTHKFRVLLLNARTQPSFDQTDDGVDAETSLSLSLHLYLSSPLLHFLLTLTFGL